jgi:hypothetical protein
MSAEIFEDVPIEQLENLKSFYAELTAVVIDHMTINCGDDCQICWFEEHPEGK